MDLTSLIESLPKDIVQCLTQTLIDDFINEEEKIKYIYNEKGRLELVQLKNVQFPPFVHSEKIIKYGLDNLDKCPTTRVSLYTYPCDETFYLKKIDENKYCLKLTRIFNLSIIISRKQLLEIYREKLTTITRKIKQSKLLSLQTNFFKRLNAPNLEKGYIKNLKSSKNVSMSFTVDKKKWEVFCLTDGWVETGEITGIPTECPIEGNHAINIDSVHIIQEAELPDFVLDDTKTFVLKKQGNNITHYYGSRPNEVHISQVGQGDHTTIQAAVNTHTEDNVIFIIHPGTYIEANPITLNRGCSLRAHGSAANTFIIASNPFAPIIITNNMCEIFNLTIAGAAGPGGCGIYYDGTGLGNEFSFVSQVIVSDCFYGIHLDGGANKFLLLNSSITHTSATCQKGIYLTNGADMNSVTTIIGGSPINKMPVAIDVDGHSSIHSVITSIRYPGIGIHLNDSSEIDLSECFISYSDIGVQIGNVSANCVIFANTIDIREAATDLNILADDATISIKGGQLNGSKINNPNGVKINAIFNAQENGKKYNVMTGDISVGAITEPSKIQIGQGKYSMEILCILHNDDLESGVWTDKTEEANSFDGSVFELFPSNTANCCVYIGSKYPILGFKAHVTTDGQLIDYSDVVWEYAAPGNTWVEVSMMNTYATEPYYSSNKQFFESDSKHHVRLGVTKNTNMATRELNGMDKYWLRGRIVNDITSIPELEYIKLHTSSTKINDDGWLEYFGDARPVARLPWSINMASPANSSPGNRDLYLGDNLGVGRIENLFQNGTVDRIGLNSYLPPNIDTSFPLKLRWSYTGTSSTTNNIRWMIRWGFTNDHDDVYDSTANSPTTAANEQSLEVISVVPNGQDDKQLNETAKLNIERCQPRPESGNPDIVWITVERTGNHSSDTYTGDVAVIQFNVEYVKWCEGGHLLSY